MKFLKLTILSFFFIIALPITADDEKNSIDNITIIGKKSLPGSATKVTVKDLEKFETMDIHKALASVPGINVRPEEGYGLRPNISIRGTYPDRSGKITLMEDGILIAPAPYAASSAYYFPSFSRINGIEVVKGPSAIRTGPYTIGGAINLISTPIPKSASGFLNQEFGSDGN
nr:TonB-dependent receptor plug domain-containing protein [Gammaproteobacteria bacterium]